MSTRTERMEGAASTMSDGGERFPSAHEPAGDVLTPEVEAAGVADVAAMSGGGAEVEAMAGGDAEAAVDVEKQPWTAAGLIGLVAAVACSAFVFLQMRPDLLFADTTPSGGDMGAHVWGPAFLRDHLLPAGRLSGWTPDWYAGFPAFHFYMVIPSLAIVGLNAGLPMVAAIPVAVLLIAGSIGLAMRRGGNVALYLVPAILVALVVVPFPYGIAFKLISVSGLVFFPLAAWAMGRLARSPEPVPAFLAVASLFFLFDTNFTIYGGNIASTLAGEFAFSISLCLTLLAIGLAVRGMDENRGRVLSAVVIGLVALTHVIPVFFAIIALGALIVLGRTTPRLWPLASGVALVLPLLAYREGEGSAFVIALSGAAILITLLAVVVAEPEVRRRFWWLLVTGPVAALLSFFWLLPFYLREPYFNDMGWERLNDIGPAILTVPMKVALPVAAVGLVLSLAQRERIGVLFATTGAVFVAAVANLDESALWNARLLPFFYLSVYMVAAIGAALVLRFVAISVAEDFERPDQRITVGATVAGLLAGLIAVSIPLRIMPFGQDNTDGTYDWLAFTSHARSFVPSWTAWNYSGYEAKPSYREYRDVVTAMAGVGDDQGCGRAMWEYSADLDRYGTPMALMLLPHWTDGCIGSMEGLYFESSATTPFHFLNQSVLSEAPSRAQRDLPYLGYDINRGVSQLQVMGVRYYMALTDASIAAARENPDLTEVAEAPPFMVFEVAGSDLVEALDVEPLVVSGRTEEQAGPEAGRFDIGWVSEAVTYYNDPASYPALPAEDGPSEWDRVNSLGGDEGVPTAPVTVSDIEADTSSISFSVDQVGTPVLVKASYFPNWKADGADGPWRAGPNLMVVVPTETDVRLSYGRTLVDWLGVVATVVGLLGLVGLWRLDAVGAGPSLLGARRRSGGDGDPDGGDSDAETTDDYVEQWLAERAAIDADPDALDVPEPGDDDAPEPTPDRAPEPVAELDASTEEPSSAAPVASAAAVVAAAQAAALEEERATIEGPDVAVGAEPEAVDGEAVEEPVATDVEALVAGDGDLTPEPSMFDADPAALDAVSAPTSEPEATVAPTTASDDGAEPVAPAEATGDEPSTEGSTTAEPADEAEEPVGESADEPAGVSAEEPVADDAQEPAEEFADEAEAPVAEPADDADVAADEPSAERSIEASVEAEAEATVEQSDSAASGDDVMDPISSENVASAAQAESDDVGAAASDVADPVDVGNGVDTVGTLSYRPPMGRRLESATGGVEQSTPPTTGDDRVVDDGAEKPGDDNEGGDGPMGRRMDHPEVAVQARLSTEIGPKSSSP
ncbi:MAG: hypothetical protein AAGD35_01850 [Actinomycetota bacterium]